MPSAHKVSDADEPQFYVHRHTGPIGTRPLAELSRVTVDITVTTIEGDEVAAGTRGTIVAVWGDGIAYDVEFAGALGPATVGAAFVKLAEGSG